MKRGLYILLFLFSLPIGAQQTALPGTTERHYRDVKFLQNEQQIQDASLNASALNRLLAQYSAQYTPRSPQYAECVLWCAYVCVKKGDNVQSKRALVAGRQLFKQYGTGCFDGKDTINEIFSLDIETNIEYNTNRFYMAIKSGLRACELKKTYFGEKSEIYLKSLLEVSHLYAMFGDYKKASYYHNIAFEAYVEQIKKEFEDMGEAERSMYWEKAKVYTDYTITLAHTFHNRSQRGKGESVASSAYNAALITKGLLLNTSIEAALQQRNGKIMNMKHLTIRWEDVAAQLGDNDVAIEFYQTDTKEYGAILLKKGWDSPKVLKLASVVAPRKYAIRKKRYPKLQNALESVDIENYSNDQASFLWQLSKAIWTDDIVHYFPKNGEGRVYFAADGALQTVGIEYLPFARPDANGHFLSFSEVYPMYRLSSTRELVLRRNESPYTDMVVYGGLRYDMTLTDLEKDAKMYHKQDVPLLAYNSEPKVRSSRKVEEELDYLGGTLTEADSIVALINRSSSPYQAQAYTGMRGTETSFKALSDQQPRLIHIATHGFFFRESDSKYKQLGFGDNPMSRSGLLFSGACYKWYGDSIPDNLDDGILTALEISNLHLQGLDMVVLSACETGKGEIKTDGVFGLQRGFKIAGTKSILMSLWKVSDEATCLLMTEFYRYWLSEHQPKHDALEHAIQSVRSHTENGWDNPRFWAAFVLLDAIE